MNDKRFEAWWTSNPARGSNLPVEVMAPCMKQPAETRIRAREYSMVQAADALIASPELTPPNERMKCGS